MPRKPKARPPSRAQQVMRSHPVIAWSTIAALAGFAVSIAPGVLWAVNHFQTVAEAKIADEKLREMIALHQAADARLSAWSSVQSIKNEVVALRNRVNDCDIRKEKREPMSVLEMQACGQYRNEFEDATRRFNEIRKQAMDASVEKR